MNKQRQKVRSELTLLSVDDWEQIHVAEWLQEIGFQGKEKLALLDNIPSGSLLPQFTKDDIHDFAFLNPNQKQVLWKAISAIIANQNKYISTGTALVNEKMEPTVNRFQQSLQSISEIEKQNRIMKKLKKTCEIPTNITDDDLFEITRRFYDPSKIKELYLNTNFKKIRELFEQDKLHYQKQSKHPFQQLLGKKNIHSLFSSRDTPTQAFSSVANTTTSVITTPTTVTTEEEEEEVNWEEIEKMELSQPMKDKIKVKLLISETRDGSASLRQLLSPILSTLQVSPQFGLFHSALIIGPWLLEFNNSSLITPRKCYSKSAVLASDIENHLQIIELNVVIEKLCDVISYWNVFVEYDKRKRNCQHFVDDLLKHLDIKVQFEGQLLRFIEKLRNKGICKKKYAIPMELANTNQLQTFLKQVSKECISKSKKNNKFIKIEFKSHTMLDDFVNELITLEPQFHEKYKDDYFLLKSMDRAFWLRHFSSKMINLDYVESHHIGGCAFGNPEENSMVKDWF